MGQKITNERDWALKGTGRLIDFEDILWVVKANLLKWALFRPGKLKDDLHK